MLINIEQVQVSDRIRKDFGNIEELAQDIKENGLINPPVVTPEHILIAGERRLRAMKYLDFKQIEVRVMSVKDAEHALNLEISENETRKDFSKLERLDYARRLERIESVKAKERQKDLNGKTLLTENFPQAEKEKGETRDIVAEKIGIGSGKQYEKEKFIEENASPEILQKWDKGDITTHKAYIELKEQLAKKEDLERMQLIRINSINSQLAEVKQAKEKAYEIVAEKDKQIKKLKAEVKTEIIYEESPELQEALFNAQQKANELNEKLRDTTNKLSELQYIEEKEIDKKRLEDEIEELKEEKNKYTKNLQSLGKVYDFITRTKAFIKDEMLHIPTLTLPPNNNSEVFLNDIALICDTLDNFSYAIKNQFKRVL